MKGTAPARAPKKTVSSIRAKKSGPVSWQRGDRQKKLRQQSAGLTSRQRGYSWEDTLVKRFKAKNDWKAFRLGSPSIGLPDILAINTKKSMMYVIEAKAGTSTTLSVPADQIRRCLEWTGMFDVYKKRHVLLVFKFLSKKQTGGGTYGRRQLREFYKVWDESNQISDCTCTYDGRFYTRTNGIRIEILLKECVMPFKTKQRDAAIKRAKK